MDPKTLARSFRQSFSYFSLWSVALYCVAAVFLMVYSVNEHGNDAHTLSFFSEENSTTSFVQIRPTPTRRPAAQQIPILPSLIGNRIARLTAQYTGLGVTVGIISFAFNKTHLQKDVEAGFLPGLGNPFNRNQLIINLTPTNYTLNQEGRAMLQVVHRIAPNAKLCFAASTEGPLAELIRKLANKTGPCRADIIADDILGFDESPFEDSDIDDAIDDFSRAGGIYFTVANNYASWAYQFPMSLYPRQNLVVPQALRAIKNATEWHRFSDGLFFRKYSISPGAKFANFYWNEPYNLTWTQMELYLFNGTLTSPTLIGIGTKNNTQYVVAAKRVDFKVEVAGDYFIAIGVKRRDRPKAPVVPPLTGWLLVSATTVVNGSIRGHAAGRSVLTIGAYHWNYTIRPSGASGRGPVTRFWNSKKRLISTTGELRYKPDFGAAHCTPTSFFITNPWVNYTVGGVDFPQFCGTSGAVCNMAGGGGPF
mmetsp:Transcript_42291/g.68583  ORF Transcript_42291/g.68583 Transcript_42291/m.68583 type:complete len:479 (-) Transcript_42291:17-1453(-)